MEILKSIIKSINNDASIKEVRIGSHWTAVVSNYCGLASTLNPGICRGHAEDEDEAFHSFTDMTALKLAEYSFLPDIAKASIGLAAINSLIDVNMEKCEDLNGLDFIRNVGKNKNISIIGHFPFLDELAKRAKNLWIIEKRPGPGDLPVEKSAEYLPISDIIIISGTTLINHTLAGILKLCNNRSIKMLLGPTTPMADVLFDYGIDILSGSVVTNLDIALKYISEGANFIRLKKSGSVRFATMIKDRDNIIKRCNAAA